MSSRPGVAFGRYRLVEPLGSGGMAVVHRAVIDGPRGFAKTLVVKRILAQYSHDPSFVSMLVSEARLSALLRHPAIVQVHDFGEVGGEYFLAMEYIEGHDLVAVRKGCRAAKTFPPPGLVCHIVSEVAAALAYAHALTDEDDRPLEIVHRDVSPSNIMVTKQGSVKLLDFGIARAAECVRDERTRTGTGTLKGKISYMAPEQADGLGTDRRSDIFALGVVFYECLTLRRLFKSDNELTTLRLVREANVRPPSELAPDIGADIDAVVRQMLTRDPAERYGSCDEVVAALAPIIHRLHADAPALKRFLAKVPPIRAAAPAAPAASPTTILGELKESEAATTPATPSRHEPPVSADEAAPTTATHSMGEINPVSGLRPPSRLRSPTIWITAVAVAALLLHLALRHEPSPAPTTPATTTPAPPAATTPPPPGTTTMTPTTPTAPPMTTTPPPPPPTATRSVVASTPAPSSKPPVDKPQARLRVTGTAGAEILVDGALVGHVPAALRLPGDAAKHELMVRRPGFVRMTRTIALASDSPLDIDAQLQRMPPAPSRHAAPSPPRKPKVDALKPVDPFAE